MMLQGSLAHLKKASNGSRALANGEWFCELWMDFWIVQKLTNWSYVL